MNAKLFRERLRSAIEADGRPKGEIAKAVGVRASFLSRWLKDTMPEIQNLTKLANVLGADIHWLAGDSDKPPPIIKEKGAEYHGARSMLAQERIKKGYSQKFVADSVGYSLGVYQNIEEGGSRMSRGQAEKVAKLLHIDVEVLLDGSDHPPQQGVISGSFGEKPDLKLPPGMKAKFIPLIAMAECGPNMTWTDGDYTGEGFLMLDNKDPEAFALKLSGESMLPTYAPGDVAIVYPGKPPRNGCLVIACLTEEKGGDVMFKIYQASGENVTLSSYNAASFPAMQFPRDSFAWIYSVIAVMKYTA